MPGTTSQCLSRDKDTRQLRNEIVTVSRAAEARDHCAIIVVVIFINATRNAKLYQSEMHRKEEAAVIDIVVRN